MPTFDFQCRKCDHIFEHSRPFGSSELPSCPACGSKRTEKLIAPPAVHFKGSGWYKTDSKAASPAPTKKKDEKKDTPASEPKTDVKSPETKPTETKPSEKKETKAPEKP